MASCSFCWAKAIQDPSEFGVWSQGTAVFCALLSNHILVCQKLACWGPLVQRQIWGAPTSIKMDLLAHRCDINGDAHPIYVCPSIHRPVMDMIGEIQAGHGLGFGPGKLRELRKLLPDDDEVPATSSLTSTHTVDSVIVAQKKILLTINNRTHREIPLIKVHCKNICLHEDFINSLLLCLLTHKMKR